MRYEDFRRKGLFMSSGVVEAGYRVLIGQRPNQSGMFWTVNGANSIIVPYGVTSSVTPGKIFGNILLVLKSIPMNLSSTPETCFPKDVP
jgi:hypothetical protein